MRKTVLISTISLAMAMLMMAPLAHAKTTSIFLNGVDITGVRNQTFKEATVHIDHNGDVHLNAPKYKVEVVDDDAPTSAAASAGASQAAGANSELRNRYYLATKPSPGGAAQYDFVVKVNGVERKIVPAGSKPVIMEISAWFKKGENKIEVVMRKNLAGEGNLFRHPMSRS